MAGTVLSANLPTSPLLDKQGNLTFAWQTFFRSLRIAASQFDLQGTLQGPVASTVVIDGNPLGKTLQYIDSGGIVESPGIDFSRVYLNQSTDFIKDGEGSPLTGGKAAFAALLASGPRAGQVLQFNGTQWKPVALAQGGVTKLVAGANITLTPPGGTGQVEIAAAGSSNYTLGGNLVAGDIALGAGAGTGAVLNTVAGQDGNHRVTITAGTTPTAGAAIWTCTFTASRGRVTYPVIQCCVVTELGTFVDVASSSASATAYTAEAIPGQNLIAGQEYGWSVSAP